VASRFAADAAFAREIAEQAGRLLFERYERVEEIDYKLARDVVTEVDHLSEALIMGAIRERFPTDGILAEESGAHHGKGSAAAPRGMSVGRTWIVDPLDGTINYANGIPFFCVSLALAVDGRPIVGVIRDPLRDETFAATADGPATLDGRRISVSTKERLVDVVMALSVGGRAPGMRTRRVRRAIRVPRQMGSAALALTYVANGRFDAFSQTTGLSAWDVAAAGLIAQRAGAVVTDMAGGPWFDLAAPTRGMGVLAAPSAHHGTLLELLREP
jgi:myo-inositol-1(or 4)-monophosphatase